SFACAGVADREVDGVARVVDGKTRGCVGGVGQAVAEGEERLLVRRFEPFVTDLGSLGVPEVEGFDLVRVIRLLGGKVFKTGDNGMGQLRVILGEGDGKLGGGGDLGG